MVEWPVAIGLGWLLPLSNTRHRPNEAKINTSNQVEEEANVQGGQKGQWLVMMQM